MKQSNQSNAFSNSKQYFDSLSNMCITSTSRRRSLEIKILPSMLLGATTSDSENKAAAAVAISEKEAPSVNPMSSHALIRHIHNGANHLSKSKLVQHDYHDHAGDPTVDPKTIKHKAKGGVITPFPVKLHSMLDKIEADGLAHVVSWQPHGRCFVVHKTKEFMKLMPKYFNQSKIASFQRQLNLYGFNRLTSGIDKGGYYHELFLKGKVSLAYDIHRMRVKGTRVRLPTNPDEEPNFYALPPIMKNMVASLPTSHSEEMPVNNKQEDKDVMYFEGCPFHYLDPLSMPPVPPLGLETTATAACDNSPELVPTKASSVVSDSESDDLPIVPSFMDWDAPLLSPTLQAHMRRASFRSFSSGDASEEEKDMDTFFRCLSMPVDRYHNAIENMREDDETAFGYLLEQAITE